MKVERYRYALLTSVIHVWFCNVTKIYSHCLPLMASLYVRRNKIFRAKLNMPIICNRMLSLTN